MEKELEILADFLLLCWCYILEKRIPAAGEAGLKRKNISASKGISKYISQNNRDDNYSTILFNIIS